MKELASSHKHWFTLSLSRSPKNQPHCHTQIRCVFPGRLSQKGQHSIHVVGTAGGHRNHRNPDGNADSCGWESQGFCQENNLRYQSPPDWRCNAPVCRGAQRVLPASAARQDRVHTEPCYNACAQDVPFDAKSMARSNTKNGWQPFFQEETFASRPNHPFLTNPAATKCRHGSLWKD